MLTNQFAVLGHPITHSKSPLLHNASYRFLGLPGTYTRMDVQGGELEKFLHDNQLQFDAFSITMPLKEEAFALAKQRDELTSIIGVANTLIRHDDIWVASNTDILGFKELLTRQFVSNLESPLVLGSGSTAKSAILALSLLGVKSLRVMARNASAVEKIQVLFPSLDVSHQHWGEEIHGVSLAISAVPEIAGVSFGEDVTQFIDVTYGKQKDNFTNAINASRYTYLDGLHLLVYQAAFQVIQMRSIDMIHYEDIVKVMFKALAEEN